MRVRRFLAVAACAGLFASVALAGDDYPKITQLGWLTGRWLAVRPAKPGAAPIKIREEWNKAHDGTMMSLGTTTRNDTIIDSELAVIRESGKYLVYEAHPRNQESAVFHSIEVSDSTAVFENRQHDFPQRIGYRRFGADSLLAFIEGTQKGKPKRVEFPYHRVK
jgi:uncharacterized protein DUF6265